MVFLQLFSLGAAVLLARGLTPEEMGRFHLLMSIVTVCTTFAKIGFDEALAYMIPTLSRNNPKAAAGTVVYSISLSLALSAIIGVAVFFAAVPLATWVFHLPAFAVDLRWLIVMLPAMVVMLMATAVLRGLGRSDLRALVYYYATGLSFPLLLAGLMFGGLDAREAYIARLLSLVVGGGIGILLMRRLLSRTIGFPTRHERRSLHRAGGVLILASLFHYMVEQPLVDLTVMNWLGLSDEIGQYAVAARLASVLAIVPTALTIVAGPAFSATAMEVSPAEAWGRFQQTSARAGIITITGCLGVLFLGRDILRVFGNQYEEAYSVLAILAVGYGVAAAFNSGSPMLIARGERVVDCSINIGCAVAMTLLAFFLGRAFGAMGVAAGTAIAFSSLNIGKRIVCKRRLRCPVGRVEIVVVLGGLVAAGLGFSARAFLASEGLLSSIASAVVAILSLAAWNSFVVQNRCSASEGERDANV